MGERTAPSGGTASNAVCVDSRVVTVTVAMNSSVRP